MWEDVHPSYDFVNTDLQLDPEGEDLPWNCVVELRTICNEACNHPICEVTEEHDVLVEQLTNTKSQAEAPSGTSNGEVNLAIFELISQGPELRKHVEKATNFLKKVKKGYVKDILFSKI